jgi:hypothetical protein
MQEIARREFILKHGPAVPGRQRAARRCPVGPGDGTGQAAVAAAASAATGGKAKSVIYLFMTGGMSHLDTFDPKPDNKEVKGRSRRSGRSRPACG